MPLVHMTAVYAFDDVACLWRGHRILGKRLIRMTPRGRGFDDVILSMARGDALRASVQRAGVEE